MFTEFMYIALAVCLLLGACSEVGLAYGMSFETLLRTAFFEFNIKKDYMSRSAHQKRAPKTFSWPLDSL